MEKRIINLKKINILSLSLFFITLLISMLIQYNIYKYISLEPKFIIIVSPILLILFHESFHYIAFLLFTDIPQDQICFKSFKGSPIPFVTTTAKVNRDTYIIIMLFPTILLALIVVALVFLNSNILFSVITAGVISMGSGDLLIVHELLKIDDSCKVIPTHDVLGFVIT